MSKSGDRVIAISHSEDGVIYSYGEGEYIGKKIPAEEPFKSLGIENPCIKLDTGKYVWGYMCWWGPVDIAKERLGFDVAKEIEIIEPDDNVGIYEKDNANGSDQEAAK